MSAPTPAAPRPTGLSTEGNALVIQWSDGARHVLPWQLLRDACPCATCREKRQAPPESPQATFSLPVLSLAEAQPIRATAVRPVGNYAYHIDFTDGHTTGIYSLKFLRELGERS